MTISTQSKRLIAVLGPTNTGKTHLAVERMLGHSSGMIGFPLRLLARENYDRIVREKGRGRVALITGEERIVPPGARWFVCTVESMPLDRPVEFLGVDEIQLASDPERGHIFTHRLLHARGGAETMVMGAETIRPLIRRLLPDTEFIARPRFSELAHAGYRKLTRLPPRSAVVAFSATEVYAIAETMRRQRGGAAVVMGALSPRTRNAQVAMYQSGEVDYLVATDAIGMGLNMDVDHVAFARLAKFDGSAPRRLRASEVAQIAGRAGRHTAKGTFGTTDEAGEIDEETVAAVEEHRFEPLSHLMWRNADLDFRSPELLIRSLEVRPGRPELRRVGDADDHLALSVLTRDDAVREAARGRERVELLWEVCQIPDFRKILSDAHTRLLTEIFRQLAGPTRQLDRDWVARAVDRLDRTEGDIDALTQRIAHIRTWTYISHRGGWLDDPVHWQERTRAVEDRLSDALHDRLTQRFVDRRAQILVRSRKVGQEPVGAVAQSGDVTVDGEFVGRLQGFGFRPDEDAASDEAKALKSLARRALVDEIPARVKRLEEAADAEILIGADGTLSWDGAVVGRIRAGASPLKPTVSVAPSDLIEPALRERILKRLERLIHERVDRALGPILHLHEAAPDGPARGLAFQLAHALGSLPRPAVADLVASLTPEGRKALRRAGVRIGRRWVWAERALKPQIVALRALIWGLGRTSAPPPVPTGGATTIVRPSGVPDGYWSAIGYAPTGPVAIRIDRLEALDDILVRRARAGPFTVEPALAGVAGVQARVLHQVLTALGYHSRTTDEGATLWEAPEGRSPSARQRRRSAGRREAGGPFAKLIALKRP